MSKKYSKNKMKIRRTIPIIIAIFVIIFVICLSFVIYVSVKNNIVIERVDDSAKFVDDATAQNSTPIILDNIVVGAVNSKTWVSQEKYYFKSKNKENIDIDIYSKTGKAGKYSITSMKKDPNDDVPYVITNRTNKTDEYFAISSNGQNNMLIPATKSTLTSEELSSAKKSLGIYRLLNTSFNVTSVYAVQIDPNTDTYGKIVCTTSKNKNIFGVYSAVIFVDSENNAQLIKFNYIKNVKNAADWPVYSFEFSGDLNSDGKNEIIIQETTQSNVTYDILEYRTNKFYQVLSSSIKI